MSGGAPPPKRRRRWGLIAPFVLFAALALGWTGYWHHLRGQAEAGIAAFLAEERADGAEVSVSVARVWGFPRELAFELTDTNYSPADRAWRAATPRLRLNVNPINPRHIILEAPAPISFTFASGARSTLTSPDLRISVRHEGDALAQAGVEGTDVSYDDPGEDGRGFRAARIVANLRPDPRGAGAHQVAIDVEQLQLARPVRAFEAFGQVIERGQAMIVIEQSAALLDPPGDDPVEFWLEAGGAVRVDSARVQWGPAAVSAQGRVALDAERRYEGRLDVSFEQPAAAIQALAQSPGLPREAAQALQLLALGAALSGEDFDTHVSAEGGRLALGGVNVRGIDPVYGGGASPPPAPSPQGGGG